MRRKLLRARRSEPRNAALLGARMPRAEGSSPRPAVPRQLSKVTTGGGFNFGPSHPRRPLVPVPLTKDARRTTPRHLAGLVARSVEATPCEAPPPPPSVETVADGGDAKIGRVKSPATVQLPLSMLEDAAAVSRRHCACPPAGCVSRRDATSPSTPASGHTHTSPRASTCASPHRPQGSPRAPVTDWRAAACYSVSMDLRVSALAGSPRGKGR